MNTSSKPTLEEIDILCNGFKDHFKNRGKANKATTAALDSMPGKEPEKASALDQLMAMEGLENVKEIINRQINYASIMKMRKEFGLKAPERIFNIIMTGNPGTGKTTVARLIASIFHEHGLLSKGHTVETNRAGLVGKYIGESEAITSQKIAEAAGGVLMIDELYALTADAYDGGQTRDFGFRVIDTLMPVLSRAGADMIVVGCGYRAEMQQFLSANPGLASRFPLVLDFADLSADQLFAITSAKLNEFDFSMQDESAEALRSLIDKAMKVKDFGNARFATSLAENNLIPAVCDRISAASGKKKLTKTRMKELSAVLPSDIPTVEELFPLSGKRRASVGFRGS